MRRCCKPERTRRYTASPRSASRSCSETSRRYRSGKPASSASARTRSALLTASATWPAAVPPWLQYVARHARGRGAGNGYSGSSSASSRCAFAGTISRWRHSHSVLICVGVFRESKFLRRRKRDHRHPAIRNSLRSRIAGPSAFWFAWAVAAAVALLALNLLRGRAGRAFEAIRNDELAAETVGVPTRRYKIFAFAFAGASGRPGRLALRFVSRPGRSGRRRRFALDRSAADGRAGRCGRRLRRTARRDRHRVANIYGHDLENWRPVIYGALGHRGRHRVSARSRRHAAAADAANARLRGRVSSPRYERVARRSRRRRTGCASNRFRNASAAWSPSTT